MRVDFTKGLNQKFSLSHSINMGAREIPSQSAEIYKVPTATYEFGANYIDPKLMLIGRVMTDGRVIARGRRELTENLSLKSNSQLTSDEHMSHGIANFNYKGRDCRVQFQLGNGGLLAANYIQIEPESQTRLLDVTMDTEGVLLSGVPGAGGFDAVFAIILSDSSTNLTKIVWD